ncbi:MAG: metal-sensitive transcriptional regulator, partial [Patescibacteria group bacterium]
MPNHCDHEIIIKNLRRVSGQVQGIEKMVEEKRDISDVIQQLIAASGALK